MEKIITVICNILLYVLLLYTINEYSDFFLVVSLITFLFLLIFYLIKYKKTYIDKNVIFINVLSFIIQLLITIIFRDSLIDQGYMGLGAGSIAYGAYFIVFAFYLFLLIIINIIKRIKMSLFK